MAQEAQVDVTFADRFAANMEALGLKTPGGWFDTQAKAIGSIAILAKAVKDYGPRVTVAELVRTLPIAVSAASAYELSSFLLAVGASFYVGACIGSLAVATGQTMAATWGTAGWHDMPSSVWHDAAEATRRLQGRGQR